MSNLRQAAQHALEVMDDHMYRADTHEFYEAKEALRAALAESEQNPFGGDAERYARKLREWRESYKAIFTEHKPLTTHWEGCEAVHPECKATSRKPLTDEEIDKLPWGPHEGNPMTFAEGLRDFARAIERAHGIGEQHE